MAETFTRFDAADYLITDEDIAAFLDCASEGNDPVHMMTALATVARARNMAKLARDAGISREGLYKALSPEGNPSFGTVAKVAGALGFEVTFRVAERPVESIIIDDSAVTYTARVADEIQLRKETPDQVEPARDRMPWTTLDD